MEKRLTHTFEEIEELNAWFQQNRSKFPQSMQLDASAFIPNLAATVDMLFEQAYICHNNPKMQGSILIPKKIKKNLDNL